MMRGDFGDGAIDGVETRRESEPSSAPSLPERLRHLDEEERAQGLSLKQLFAEQEHGLRQKYGDWIIWMLGAQFVIADAVFVAFAWIGRSWDLPPAVIEVWLVATVVQVVGVVAIVTRHLFPNRDRSEASA
jgi:hypothetical protein